MGLVRYAGFEKPEPRSRRASVLDLFRLGWDTQKIAAHWHITEAEALKRITVARSVERGLPDPYAKEPR